MPIMPGVCSPPPATPARVEKVMPAGVMLGSSRETTITPFASGMTIDDALEATAGRHGVLHDGVQGDALHGLVRVLVGELVGPLPHADSPGRGRCPSGWAGWGRWG